MPWSRPYAQRVDEPVGTEPWDRALQHPADLVSGVGQPSLSARLDAWVADARVDGSADARAREHWLHRAASADATFAGVLIDLAERRARVALGIAGGRRHHGIIEVLGADFVSLRVAHDAEVLVPLRAVGTLRTLHQADPSAGERVVTTTLSLVEVLAGLADERAHALILTAAGSDAVRGELRSVGQDVVTLRTDADPPAIAYVLADAITEVALG